MIVLLEILLAIGLLVTVIWAWARSGYTRLGLVLAAGVVSVFFWPWVRDADWAVVGRVALVGLAVCAVIGAYGWGLSRLRAATRERDGE